MKQRIYHRLSDLLKERKIKHDVFVSGGSWLIQYWDDVSKPHKVITPATTLTELDWLDENSGGLI